MTAERNDVAFFESGIVNTVIYHNWRDPAVDYGLVDGRYPMEFRVELRLRINEMVRD